MNEIKNLICFTYYGEAGSVVQHAIADGLDAVLAMIQDHNDIVVTGEKAGTEDPEEKKKRLEGWKGLIPVVDAKSAVKNLLKIPEEERASYYIFFDLNTGFKYAEQLYDKGFNGNFPFESDRKFEEDRDAGKEFVRKNYPDLEVAEIQEFKTIDEAIDFLGDTEDSWVLKGYDDLAETVVPSKDDPQKNAAQLISALNNGQKEYEKSGFLLEKKIMNALEITPQCVFNNGEPVYYSLDIELKRRGAGDTGGNCGCAANILIPLDDHDPVVRYAFPKAIREMAKKRKGVVIWDCSILIDPKDGTKYFGEFCSNRWGWDSVQTEMTMAGGVKKFLQSLVNNEAPFKKGTYGFAVRLFSAKGEDISIDIDEEIKEYAWPLYVHKADGKVATTGYSDDAVVITCAAESIFEAIRGAFKYVNDNVSLQDAAYRPQEDIISYSYPASIMNRYNYARQEGYFNDDVVQEVPDVETIYPADLNVGKYLDRILDSHKDYSSSMQMAIQGLQTLSTTMSQQQPFALPAPVDLEPVRMEISSLSSLLARPADMTSHNKLIDTMNAGFAKIGEAVKSMDNSLLLEELITGTRKLVEQNVEKLKIMKTRPEKQAKGNQTVTGGASISSVIMRGYGAPTSNRTTVATPGTAVQLTTTSIPCRRVDITALPNNKGYVMIGDKNVSAVSNSEKGNLLNPTNTATISISDPSLIWVDVQSGNGGDGVSYTTFN